MADYIYLLENRLSLPQREALQAIRNVVREKGMTLFLVGGAVRDLTAGTSVRDLDIAVQGNALKLKKDLEKAGGTFSGEYDPSQTLFFEFPGSVRVEISSALAVTYPKPGRPVYRNANILEDLRRRDFTANAMALSLNEGSYGLLMDPLNGVADIENRELRLVSNYGFIEDPSRLIRAARLSSRLGWQMEERTRARYETAKEEGYISALPAWYRGYELEEIAHEEDTLRVLRHLEQEGWLKDLLPAWTAKAANAQALDELHQKQGQLQTQGIFPDISSAAFPLLTAKLAAKEVEELKASFPRTAFVHAIDNLEAETKAFSAEFTGKAAALPSAAWKLLHATKPETVLHLVFTSKSTSIQNRFKAFFTEWPQARLKIPYALMQEMRITPDLPVYNELVDKLFFELMDGKLTTTEEMKAYLEPYSPPAPPPPVHLRRPRAPKKESKRSKKAAAAAAASEPADDLLASELAVDLDMTEESPKEGIEEEETGSTKQPSKSVKKVSPSASEKKAAVKTSAPVKEPAAPAKKALVAEKAAVQKSPAKTSTATAKKADASKAAPAQAKKAAPAPSAAKKTAAATDGKKTPAKNPTKAVAKKAVPAKKKK